MKRFLLACAVLVLAPACARTQKLIVRTDPGGAEVAIIKRGQLRTSGHVAGIVTVGASERYEDEPVSIGTSPVMYEFPVVEPQAGVFVPYIAARQDKICREVVIRAWDNGKYAEQVIPVTGDVAEVYLQLSPAPPPSPRHAASPVQPPRS